MYAENPLLRIDFTLSKFVSWDDDEHAINTKHCEMYKNRDGATYEEFEALKGYGDGTEHLHAWIVNTKAFLSMLQMKNESTKKISRQVEKLIFRN